MTKKHFKALAEALSEARPKTPLADPAFKQWERCVRAVADVCASTNPRFNRSKFLFASGMETP